MNFVIFQRDVVFVHGVTFLNPDFFRPSPCHIRQQLFQVANCIVLVALHGHLLSQPIIADNFDHAAALVKKPTGAIVWQLRGGFERATCRSVV